MPPPEMPGTRGVSVQRVRTNMCVVLGAERRLKQRREIGLENEAEAKACVQTPGEAGKSLAEPEQAAEVGRAAPGTALQTKGFIPLRWVESRRNLIRPCFSIFLMLRPFDTSCCGDLQP